MKKAIIFLLLAAILLVGCAKQTELVVDTENKTISDGSFTYEYTDTTTGELRIIIIHYPNGGQYTYRREGNTGEGKYSNSTSQSPNQYTQGHLLVHAVLNPDMPAEQKQILWPLIILGAVVAALGLLQICFPDKIWDLFLRRRYQEDVSNYALTQIIRTALGNIVLGIGIILVAIIVSLK